MAKMVEVLLLTKEKKRGGRSKSRGLGEGDEMGAADDLDELPSTEDADEEGEEVEERGE